jgi:hypothetical protein
MVFVFKTSNRGPAWFRYRFWLTCFAYKSIYGHRRSKWHALSNSPGSHGHHSIFWVCLTKDGESETTWSWDVPPTISTILFALPTVHQLLAEHHVRAHACNRCIVAQQGREGSS